MLHPLEEFRYITEDDAWDTTFTCGDNRMDSFSLRDYYNWSQDSYVLVFEENNKVTGVMRLKEYENTNPHLNYIFVDMFAVRQGYNGLGRVMEKMVVEAARELKKRIISLSSLDNAVGFWSNCGYSKCDLEYLANHNWGYLTPMEKII